MNMSLYKLWEMVKDRETWRGTVHGVTKSQAWLTEQQLTAKYLESLVLVFLGS